ncbi:hypothetical protein HU200_051136 [Digitaria exilis]|uniref:DUF4220 domain-containing protein n=1 Tax=Digitaria exilis TaxID=1010633 RepID=A0A835ALU4_9POAL|nr:hypothetical protein HU200_051136 [Digitaria exilis]
MMTVSSVVQAHQWWDEWQLRFLVLLSLSIQCMLVLCCPLDRKFHLPFWLKLCIRIAYIASDAVPINALATILNRQKKAPHSTPVHGNRDLELLWAPILLMHIGGSSVVPVQNMEESEQWTKHLTVAVSQVSIALYVFYSSWPSSSADKRQLAAAILIFIPGILKCFIKPWSDGYKYWKEAELRRVIADKVDSTEESEHGFLWEACALTKALMNIEDEVKLWTIIQGVWVEMLCFSASRCRGYLHAKNIGAEYLPQAWLLLAYAGMETLPERHQRTNLKGSQLNSQ